MHKLHLQTMGHRNRRFCRYSIKHNADNDQQYLHCISNPSDEKAALSPCLEQNNKQEQLKPYIKYELKD